jgi:hypothetical protein
MVARGIILTHKSLQNGRTLKVSKPDLVLRVTPSLNAKGAVQYVGVSWLFRVEPDLIKQSFLIFNTPRSN